MKILVTGARGQLGQEVVARANARGLTVHGVGRDELDLSDWASVSAGVQGFDVVINCAAHTRVDAAEGTERDAAFEANSVGTKNLAAACVESGARLVHVSTDYVFDGSKASPYLESDPTNPQTVYGQSKLDGELSALAVHPDNCYVVRTAWVYGAYGPNFVKTMLNLAEARDSVSVVTDQIGQPTWTGDLAEALIDLALSTGVQPGVYHVSGEGECSWFEFAQEIFRNAGLDPARVKPTTSSEFVRPAPRPAYSVLSHQKWIDAGLRRPMQWEDALREFFARD